MAKRSSSFMLGSYESMFNMGSYAAETLVIIFPLVNIEEVLKRS